MTANDARVPKRNPEMVAREIEGETILVPLFKSSGDMNCIYTFNRTAARFWSLIDGRRSVADIKERILAEYDVAPALLDGEVETLLADLGEIGALEERPAR